MASMSLCVSTSDFARASAISLNTFEAERLAETYFITGPNHHDVLSLHFEI